MKKVFALSLVLFLAALLPAQQHVELAPHQHGLAYIVPATGDQVLVAAALGWGMAPPVSLIHVSQASLDEGNHYDFWLVDGGGILQTIHGEYRVDHSALSSTGEWMSWNVEMNLSESGPDQWVPAMVQIERQPGESSGKFLKRARKYITSVIADPGYRLPSVVHEPTSGS